ncbi:hypothetical protein J6590_045021 [Homalodisca vitripennis]|nr:hypothetical protein J6590_045021 [Homalodisca vitripennis]
MSWRITSCLRVFPEDKGWNNEVWELSDRGSRQVVAGQKHLLPSTVMMTYADITLSGPTITSVTTRARKREIDGLHKRVSSSHTSLAATGWLIYRRDVSCPSQNYRLGSNRQQELGHAFLLSDAESDFVDKQRLNRGEASQRAQLDNSRLSDEFAQREFKQYILDSFQDKNDVNGFTRTFTLYNPQIPSVQHF